MRNVPLKGFQACKGRKSPLKGWGPFESDSYENMKEPVEYVKEKEIEENTVENDGYDCLASGAKNYLKELENKKKK